MWFWSGRGGKKLTSISLSNDLYPNVTHPDFFWKVQSLGFQSQSLPCKSPRPSLSLLVGHPTKLTPQGNEVGHLLLPQNISQNRLQFHLLEAGAVTGTKCAQGQDTWWCYCVTASPRPTPAFEPDIGDGRTLLWFLFAALPISCLLTSTGAWSICPSCSTKTHLCLAHRGMSEAMWENSWFAGPISSRLRGLVLPWLFGADLARGVRNVLELETYVFHTWELIKGSNQDWWLGYTAKFQCMTFVITPFIHCIYENQLATTLVRDHFLARSSHWLSQIRWQDVYNSPHRPCKVEKENPMEEENQLEYTVNAYTLLLSVFAWSQVLFFP